MIGINYRDSRPIYEQIKDNLRKLLLSGAIKPDEKLPSVRDLASELAINPNTIQRAYRDLEAEGYLYSVAGKGSFACGDPEPDMKRRAELMGKLQEIVQELCYTGLSRQELDSMLDKIFEESRRGKGGNTL